METLQAPPPPLPSCCAEKPDGPQVSVTIVTEEAESLSTAHSERPANQKTRMEEGGGNDVTVPPAEPSGRMVDIY